MELSSIPVVEGRDVELLARGVRPVEGDEVVDELLQLRLEAKLAALAAFHLVELSLGRLGHLQVVEVGEGNPGRDEKEKEVRRST